MPKNMNSEAVLPSANWGREKKRIGSIGVFARSSQTTKAAVSAAPSPSAVTISGLVQPSAFPRTRPQTMPNRPALASPTPGRSRRPAGPVVSCRRVRARGTSTSPIGTLSQKIHCQAMPSTTAPPTTGPKATASPPMPPQAPSASPRRSGGTAALRIVSVSGITIAAPRPWTARARLSSSTLGASAAPTEAAVKTATPIANSRRRPKRSPSAAPVRSSTAKVSV